MFGQCLNNHSTTIRQPFDISTTNISVTSLQRLRNIFITCLEYNLEVSGVLLSECLFSVSGSSRRYRDVIAILSRYDCNIVRISFHFSEDPTMVRPWFDHGSNTVQLWFSPGLILISFQHLNLRLIPDASRMHREWILNWSQANSGSILVHNHSV